MPTEVEAKVETGLPELPEGYFWRVGEVDTNPGWYDKKPTMSPAVMIMKQAGMETKTREIPIYGANWWQKNTVVDTITETYQEMGEETCEFSQTFSGIEVQDYTDVPEFGQISSWATDSAGREYDRKYNVAVGPLGVGHVAGILYKRMQAYEVARKSRAAFKAAESAMKEDLYGDYPPKKLVGVTVDIGPVEAAVEDMMEALDKLQKKFEEYSKEYPDAPPYTKGQSAAWNNAARMLKEVIRG